MEAPAEPVALGPTEGRLRSISPESFDHPGRAAAQPPLSTDPLVFDDQIAAFGESSDTLPQQKLGEIEFLKPVNKTMKAGFQKRMGVRWKIGGTFTGVVLILCIFGLAAIYEVTQRTLRDQLDKRTLAIATNLSDAAAGHLVGKNPLALHALTRKYTLLDGLAYAVIVDGEREIVAHSLGNIPTELRQGLPVGGQRSPSRRELSFQEKKVYETSVPVLEGQMGSVHVGFWADAIEKEIQSALLPLIAIMAILTVVGALLSFLLAGWIARPIVRLREVAEKITRGDLDARGDCVKSRDEIGDLALSLERMRASLKAAMFRLSRASA
jgi:HAMP domain-containing protein